MIVCHPVRCRFRSLSARDVGSAKRRQVWPAIGIEFGIGLHRSGLILVPNTSRLLGELEKLYVTGECSVSGS